MKSQFKFRKVVSFYAVGVPAKGLVNVYDRETDEHLGQLSPVESGGYVLRKRDGSPAADGFGGRFGSGVTSVDRETSAKALSVMAHAMDAVAVRRASSVSQDCPNNWHNTAAHRETTPCPECPTQVGLAYAVRLLEGAGVQGPVFAEILRNRIYSAPEAPEDRS